MKFAHFIPCYRGYLHIEASYSMLRDFEWCGRNGHEFLPFYKSGCDLPQARNVGLSTAIKLGADYLLMQDADCAALPGQESALAKLYGDLCNHPSAAAAALVMATRDERTNAEPAKVGDVYPGEIGTGYMLIDVRRCADLWEAEPDAPMFAVERSADGTRITCGEDLFFCRKLKRAGFDVLCDSTMETAHADEKFLLVLPKADQPNIKHARSER